MYRSQYFAHMYTRQRIYWLTLALVCCLALSATLATWTLTAPHGSSVPAAQLELGQLPLAFVSNMGQTDEVVRFQVHDLESTVFFMSDGVIMTLAAQEETAPASIQLTFNGANPAATITGHERLPGVVNYLIGNDAAAWHTNLPTHASITYHQLYPGIDLRYDGHHGQLKGTYFVAAGVDPTLIRWQHNPAADVQVDAQSGNLLITLPGMAAHGPTLVEEAPIAWQEINGQQVSVAARYVVAADGSIGFALGNYNSAHALIIDPTLTYSSYVGGSGREDAEGLALDGQGNIYITGSTQSKGFSTAGATTIGPQGEDDVFVTKLNAAGNAVVYTTFVGGGADDQGKGIDVDGSGNVYVAGDTRSSNFPTQSAAQNGCGAIPGIPICMGDAFVFKLNSSGNGLVYSTYLGGSLPDLAEAIAVDGSGRAYVAGMTTSDTFPTESPYQADLNGASDAFVARLTSSGGLDYSTFLGGSGEESGLAIATSGGAAYVTGFTSSGDLRTVNPVQGNLNGDSDAFVVKLNSSGNGLESSTYWGGNGDEIGYGIAVQGSSVYVTGKTESSNLRTQNPVQRDYGGGSSDAFVAKISGSTLNYATYLGGGGADEGRAVAVNGSGNAYVTGETASSNFPAPNAVQGTNQGNTDAFVVKFSTNGSSLDYGTYLGGGQADSGQGIRLSGATAIMVGVTFSSDLRTQNPVQGNNAGSGDAFVAKISDGGDQPPPTATPVPPTPTPVPPTATPLPPTATPIPTNTSVPPPTNTPQPGATDTPTPAATPIPTNTPPPPPPPTDTPVPGATNTPVPPITPPPTPLPTVTVDPLPNISLIGSYKLASQVRARTGEQFGYTIHLHNSGFGPATADVVDHLPDEVAVVASTIGNGGVYDSSARTITWRNVAVPIGGAVELTFDVTANVVSVPTVALNRAVIQPHGGREFERPFPVLIAPDLGEIDVSPPVLDGLTIGDRDVLTDRNVTLHITASDNVGVAEMYIREWQLTTSPVPRWEEVQSSGWIPYAETHAWTLGAESGVHYVGVWVADAAANLSLLNSLGLDFASLLANGATLSDGGMTPYLIHYAAGTDVTATLTPSAGDADLYVWYPGNMLLPNQKSTNSDSSPDMVSFTTPQDGTYLLLVYGETAATYDLAITPAGGPQSAPTFAVQGAGVAAAAEKNELTAEPVLSKSGLDPLGIATAPTEESEVIYLPIIAVGQ